MAADLVASCQAQGLPATAKSSAGLRQQAESLVARAGAGPDHVGWTMVTIVSEFWRDRLATAPNGRRLMLLPDCPAAVHAGCDASNPVPCVCGAGCGVATIWSAARDSGWVVESTRQAVGAIGLARCLMTGGSMGQRLVHPDQPFPIDRLPNDSEQSVDHFFSKLLGLQKTMQTLAGRDEAERRTQFLIEFLRQLCHEIGFSRIELDHAIDKAIGG
jgi:hypothetical protein